MEHSALARALIKACGGLPGAAQACRLAGRRCSVTVLSTYQNAQHPASMPADVIDLLEQQCGQAIYSAKLAASIDRPVLVDCDPREASYDLSEEVLDMQAETREAVRDGRLSPREIARLRAELSEVESAAETLRNTIAGAETALGTKLRRVS